MGELPFALLHLLLKCCSTLACCIESRYCDSKSGLSALVCQLSDAIGYIGHEDFPGKWPELIPELVAKFQSGDFHVINGVLHTAHSLFKRYFSVFG